MSRSISIIDLITYGAFTAAAALCVLDWLSLMEGPVARTAVVAALIGHHVWMRSNGRRHVDEAITAMVVEQQLRNIGEGVRTTEQGVRRFTRQ